MSDFSEIYPYGFAFEGRVVADVARSRAIMLQSSKMFFLVGTLIAIALAATVTALALQRYIGKSASFAAIGILLAAFGGASFALWLINRR